MSNMFKLANLVVLELAFDVPAVAGRLEFFEHIADRLAEQGLVAPPADFETLAHNTRADLIVVSASSLADSNYRLPDEFIPHLPCPIIILPTA